MVGTRVALLEAGRLALVARPDEFVEAREGLARAFLDTIEPLRGRQ
ncbi:MAG: hypothetical protein WCJ30_17845 [Deltaproteobacteria bacterium]